MNLHSLLQSEGLDPEALPFESEPAPSGRFEFEPLPAGTRLRAPSDFDKVFADAGAAFDVDPVILKSIAFAESGFDPDIISGKKRSRAGAIGLMQFMPDTAKEYDNLDPTNPVQSIFAAAQYMRKSLDKFGGDYGKAVASYNHGPNRDTYNREDWDQRVPPETQKYLMTVFDAAGRFKDGSAERGLPQGVTPSKAGAGRGSVNPTLDAPVTDTGDETARLAARYKAPDAPQQGGFIHSVGDFFKPAPTSVLESYKPTAAEQQAANTQRLRYGAGPIKGDVLVAANEVASGNANSSSPTVNAVAKQMQERGDTFTGYAQSKNTPILKEGARDAKAAEFRSAGEWAVDSVSALAQGSVSIPLLPASILAPGGDTAKTLRSWRDAWSEQESDVLKAQRVVLKERIQSEEGFAGKYASTVLELVTNPALGLSEAIKQVPNYLAVIGASRIAAGAVGAGFNAIEKSSPTLALANALSSGAVKGGAQATAATAGGMAASVVMTSGDAAGDVYETLTDPNKTPKKVWEQNEDYQALIKQGLSHKAAVMQIAEAKARFAAVVVAPLGLFGFMGAESALATKGIAGLAASFGPKAAAKTFGKEIVGENIEEGGTKWGGNVVTSTVDPRVKWDEGVAEAAATATVTSAPMAGLAARSQLSAPPAQTQDPRNGLIAAGLLDPQTYDGGIVGAAGTANPLLEQLKRKPAPTVESQPTTPQVPPTVAPTTPVTPDTTKTQAVDNIAAAIKELEGGTTQAATVQPGQQTADTGTAPVAQWPADTTEGLAPAGEAAVAGQSESAQSLTDAPLTNEGTTAPTQAVAPAVNPITESMQVARQMADRKGLTAGIQTQLSKGKSIAQATKAMRDDFDEAGIPREEHLTFVHHVSKTLASQPTQQTNPTTQAAPAPDIGAEMAALKARSQTQAQPAQQTAAPAPAKKPRTKPQPLLNDKEIDAKTDAVMAAVEKFGNPGGITRELTRKLIVEKGMEVADSTIASLESGAAKKAKNQQSIDTLYAKRKAIRERNGLNKPAATTATVAASDVATENVAKNNSGESVNSSVNSTNESKGAVKEVVQSTTPELPRLENQPQASKFAAHDAIAREYGYTVGSDGGIALATGKESGLKVALKGKRFQVRSKTTDDIVYSGATVDSMGKFLESFWGAEKIAKAQPAERKPVFPVTSQGAIDAFNADDSTQSAIGNNGNFDGTNPDIRFSRGTNESMTNKDVVGNQGGRFTEEQAAEEIANDDDLFNTIAEFTADDPDIFESKPEMARRLRSILAKVTPYEPWFKTYYRGEPSNSPATDRKRGFRSWSGNERTAKEFADEYRDGVVRQRSGKSRAVAISTIFTARMRVRDGESHYPGDQAESFILDGDESTAPDSGGASQEIRYSKVFTYERNNEADRKRAIQEAAESKDDLAFSKAADRKAAQAALARIMEKGVTSPDDLRALLRVPGYSKWAKSTIAGDVAATTALRGELQQAFSGSDWKAPKLNDQGIISVYSDWDGFTAQNIDKLTKLADKYDAPIGVRGGAATKQLVNRLDGFGFELYNGLQERADRMPNVMFGMIRPAGGITATTPLFSQGDKSPRTPISTIRQAITKAYGNLLNRLEGMGLVTLTQTEEEAIAAAAQARADKTGGDVEVIKAQLRKSVLASVAPQTESENFKRWFGDSQVVDAAGRPLVVFHGSPQGGFDTFDVGNVGAFFSSRYDIAASYAGRYDDVEMAALDEDTYDENQGVYSTYLQIKSPMVVDWGGKDWGNGPDGLKLDDVANRAKRAGHDGLIVENVVDSGWLAPGLVDDKGDGNVYVVFKPEQIKSSTDNNGDFDPNNLDIRRSADGNLEGFFDPATGKSFLIADNLTAESAPATLMHEVGIHMAAEGKFGPMFDRALTVLNDGSLESTEALRRMQESGETSGEEAAAYLVTVYETNRTNAPASVKQWMKDMIAAVRAWLFSKGVIIKADQLTVADIAAVARANASRIAKGKGWVGSAQKDGAFRFGNTDGQRSKDIATVADAFSGEGIQLEGFSNFGGVQVGVRLKDAPTYTMEFKSQDGAGPLTIDATQANGETGQSPGGNAGQRMYQTLFAWAHNNGRQVDADYSLSYVNELRRTSAMLSSALRFGTIDHFGELNEQQGVDGWDATDFSASVKALAEAELRKVEQRVPISSSLEIDPVTGRVYTRDSAVLERLRDGVDSEASVDGRPGADQQGASRTRNLAESEIRLAAGEVNPRPVDGVSQTAANAQTRNTDTVGNGTGVQGESLSDSELARYLASTRGGFDAHGVGVSTLKRALITRDFAGETDLPGLLYSVAGDTDIRRSVRNSGQGQLFPQQAVTTWDDMGDSKVDSLIYEGQDDRIDLKRVQENIAKAGRQVREEFDARMAETLFPGRVAKRNESFVDHEVKPLLQAMSASNVSMEELGDYLLARHAPERNAQIAKVNPGMPDGGAGTNSQGVLMTTQAAQDHIANLSAGKRTALQLLARQVDAITKGTREMLVTEGLEKASTVAAWEGAYQNYVPLFKDEAAETPGHPVGSGFSVKGGASKRAMGSTKEVTNVLAHVLMQREAAITRAEKNRVAMSLYGLALTNPNKAFWGTVVPKMSTPEIIAELQNMGVSVADAFAGMEATPTIRYVDPNTGLVTERPNPVYKNLDNALVVKVDGEDRVILFNKNNARAMRLAESLKNQNRGSGVFVEGTNLVAPVTRFMASMLTQYNPAFGMVNAVRDIQGALVNLSSTPLKGKQAKVLADVPAALKGIARDVSGNANRTQWSDLWVQFQEDGGRTGIRDLVSDPYEKAGQIEKDLKRLSSTGKLTPGNAAHAVLDLLSGFNDTLENGVRVAAYKAALDSGMSRPAAAKLARELTVDFNRKGRTGRELGKLYAFLNASVQGSARTIQTLKGPMGAKIMAGGFAIGVLQAFMLAAAGFDDDDIPEFIKSRNLIIPMGGDRYVTIPMALGLHVLPNTGRAVTELVMSGGKDIGTKSLNTLVEIVTSFNPFGGGGDWKSAHGPLTMVTPTVMDPVIDMAMNRDFTGRQISKERRNPGDVRPGATMAREGTKKSPSGQVYIGLSELINKVTLGTDVTKGAWSPTPEELRYMATVLGGGVYRETERAVNAAVLLARGEEVKPHQVPLGSRFAGTLDEEMSTMSRYYKNDEALNKFWSEFRAEAKDGNTERVAEMRKDPRYTAAAMNSKIEQNISKLNKLASENVGDKAKYEELNQRRAELMRKVNEAVKEAESK